MNKVFLRSLFLGACVICLPANLYAKDLSSATKYLGHPLTETYHETNQAFASLYYLPTPPAEGSAAFELDKTEAQDAYKLKDTARWEQAKVDADMHIDNVAKIYSGPMGITISEKTTPVLFNMMGKMLIDSSSATKSAKEFYMRKRPFVYYNHDTCQPMAEQEELRKNGSYPSGHTTFGWSIALILAELRPDHGNEILKRGYEYGQSRIICGAHWKSDVDAGYVVGAAEFSRLQSIESFKKDLAEAQKEVDAQINNTEKK